MQISNRYLQLGQSADIGEISTVGVYGHSPSCDTFDMAFKASCLVDARTYEEGTAIF
jgi:hypothetical protein